ncbi:YbhB/YbcL family Raf kinase inhibitor-like protein [Breznakiella homolactica]|uniref:YbhB/YbcL family Raf kinase inhibitor-like protein n=1 Tax=Breznakiella homolactica TaxID=2798577 RepID=A0A7T7XM35_9SPIR|nr:YbhB/YbcL family Raf kinase inhibitor-like protein [Breznakiella homolactica]QQO08845.1 YbhB/YbcL family Raf kinase inhibitor-like protein [Breznakiella homolactica]
MEESFTVSSPAFGNGETIPVRYTGRGEDLSPELQLSGLDRGARSLAVIMDDMGHPIPAFNHWTIWNIPPQNVIPGGIPPGEQTDTLDGAVQGRGYGKNRYRGPKPPFNWSHVYRFTVYVLDTVLDIPPKSRKRDLLAAMDGHIIQQASLEGRFR